jgi:uncharacterized protein
MVVGDQTEAIEFLRSRAPGVELMSTHISLIFMTGDRAFKLKRAVSYPYLDFSTPEKRLACCKAELELNRRTAPQLYLGVHSITRDDDGSLCFDGTGSLVDAVIEMRRFRQADLFDNMAREGRLSTFLMTSLAHQIAALHESAPISKDHGGSVGISAILDINDQALRAASLIDKKAAHDLNNLFRQALTMHSKLLDRRQAAGKVRRCHGDLILRNICLLDGEPTLFDCLEFDESLATIDVLYDLSFLLMDLWHRDQRDFANLVMNRYLDECDETDGLSLVPFFMAVRAAVRAHVTATQAIGARPETAEALRTEARDYVDLAFSLLLPADPILLAIGGFSGTGKSTVASQVAIHLGQPPGARTLNSDRIRKGMYGVSAEQQLPVSAYKPDVSKRVYEKLRQDSAEVLATGTAVIADAVFDLLDERLAIQKLAEGAKRPFYGIWLDAPEGTLLSRIAGRQGGPSDADAAVLAAQIERGCGTVTWQRIDARGNPADIRNAVLASLNSVVRERS